MIKSSAIHGNGLFSVRPYSKGVIVFEESALTIVPKKEPYHSAYWTMAELCNGQLPADLCENHQMLSANWSKKDREDMKLFCRRNPSYKPSQVKQLMAKLLTNATPLTNVDRIGLFDSIRYINHSCKPNVAVAHMDATLGRIQLIALRDIEVDEELLIEYAPEWRMEHFGFVCKCPNH